MADENNTQPNVTPTDGNNGADGGADNKGNDTNTDNKGGDNKPKTFTQEDLDRVAAKTRAEAKEQAEKAAKEMLDKALAEERRLAKLSQEEKEKEAKAKQEKEIADRELKITLRENRSTALEKFAESKLPTKLVDLVVDADLTKQDEKIENFTKSWNEALEARVAEELKGEAPKDPQNNNSNNGKPSEVAPTNFL